MKSTALFLSSVAVLIAVVLAAATIAQSPTGTPLEARIYPAPVNLKALPKNLTGQQVHAIMEQWSAALGVHCNNCHAEERGNTGPNDRPRLNFADDSKEMKTTARVMYTMTEKINADYVAKIDSSGLPVTCGTCHRGHLGPEPFTVSSDARKPAPQSSVPHAEDQHSSSRNANR